MKVRKNKHSKNNDVAIRKHSVGFEDTAYYRAFIPQVTAEQMRKMYSPPRTLGISDEVWGAMDSALEDSGVYTMIADGFAEDSRVYMPKFMGYARLQNIAQDGLIRACIETVADDMTREWIELKRRGEAKKKDEFAGLEDVLGRDDELLVDLTQVEQELQKLCIQSIVHEAAALVGYEGGAFIYIDTGTSADNLITPLNISPYSMELQKGHSLRFLCIDPVNVFPGDYDSLSPLSPHYFKPRWYWVLGQKVHASRLIRFVANEVPILLKPAYNFLGIPQAQILWDYVKHFQECREASARLLSKFSMTVFKTGMQTAFQSSEELAAFDARIKFLARNRTNDGILAIDKETEDVVKLETPLAGVPDVVRQSLEILAAMNRTPAVKLLGISPSGFNATGESDIRNYYDHITSQQEKVLRDGINTILKCVQLKLFGEIDDTVTFDFKPMGQEDKTALATRQKTKADTMAVYLDRGILSPEECRQALSDDPDSGFEEIDPEDLPESDADTDMGMPQEGGGNEIDDVDKAGAVYDSRVKVDTDTNRIIKNKFIPSENLNLADDAEDDE